jgi:hypothetical protein
MPFFVFYGRTHSAFGRYGRLVVLLRWWYSHSFMRISIQPLSWYMQPHGSLTSFELSVAAVGLPVSVIRFALSSDVCIGVLT